MRPRQCIDRRICKNITLGCFDDNLRAKNVSDFEGMGCEQESWKVYEQYAMGEDELAPLSLKGKTSISFGGMAATLIDSLDTLWMLDMKDEFSR